MNTTMLICIIMVMLIAAGVTRRRTRQRRIAAARRKRRRGGLTINELVRRMIGKNCTIYMGGFDGSMEGIIESIEDNWISVQTKKTAELVNLDFINRIQEKPEKDKK